MSNYAGFRAKGLRKRAEGWAAELSDARALGGPLAGASFVAGVASLHRLMFAAGGPVHSAGFGLLVGALGLAGPRTGELPVPLASAGLASAAAGLLSPLYFVWKPAAWLVPVGRFPGLVVSAIAGARLCRR